MIQPEVTSKKHPFRDRPLVYIVDDEAMLLELAGVILQPLGCEIVTFSDPEAALSCFTRAEPRPDLLITDYAMHRMNGMELILECRRIEPNQKILLLSGTVGVEIFGGAPAKPDKFLAKPYRASQLAQLVSGMLSN
jgi:CheY-like chemotaxis protein